MRLALHQCQYLATCANSFNMWPNCTLNGVASVERSTMSHGIPRVPHSMLSQKMRHALCVLLAAARATAAIASISLLVSLRVLASGLNMPMSENAKFIVPSNVQALLWLHVDVWRRARPSACGSTRSPLRNCPLLDAIAVASNFRPTAAARLASLARSREISLFKFCQLFVLMLTMSSSPNHC